ncbi:MAG: tetratricopeptide repeat protein [Gemmatimonadaceae bacterium]
MARHDPGTPGRPIAQRALGRVDLLRHGRRAIIASPPRLFLDRFSIQSPASAMSPRVFSLKLFGGASVEADGAPLAGAVAQRRRLALLALLAAAPAGGVSRERLAAYLFPEADARRAHHALSDALHAVRKALGKDAVVSAGDELRLNPAAIRADVAEFEEALAAGDAERAVLLYRGPFLDGFAVPNAAEFERWVDGERTRLAGRYARALEALAMQAEGEGDTRRAVAWRGRLAAHDPYSSSAAVRFARSLGAAGDRAGALRHLRSHVTLLREELGVGPDADVLALAEQLQAQESPGHADGRSDDHGPRRDFAPGWARPTPDEPAGAPQIFPAPAGEGAPGAREPDAGAPAAPARPSRRAAAYGVMLAALILAAVVWRGGRGASASEARATRVDPAARELYLRGRQEWGTRSREGLDRAVISFRRAVERDPDYAAAYAGLADAYVILGYLGFRPAAAMFPKGKAAALRALQLDSTLAEAYAPLGQALMWEHDWEGAERAFRTAIALRPDYATAHHWYGTLMCPLGRIREAVEHTRRASELDPLSLQINNTYGMMLHYAGESAAGLEQYRKVIVAEPDSEWVRQNPWLLSNASRVYTAHGLYDDALRMLGQALAVVPRHPRPLWDLASTYVAMGHPEKALRVFAAADTSNEQYAYFRASVFAVLGQADSAFYWLDRVTEWGPSPAGELRMDPRLAPIRADPRHPALLRRLRLAR